MKMALFRKISKATSSQLEINDSQQPGSDPGSQCPWVTVNSSNTNDVKKEGRKRYLCDLYGAIGAEKGNNWFQPSTRSCDGGNQCFQPPPSFGKTETRLLREAYQRTADLMEAMQCQMNKMEMAVSSMQTMVSRMTERQDELFDMMQDLAVMTASKKKRRCLSEETDEKPVEKVSPITPAPSPGISPRMLSTPDVHVADLESAPIPPPSFFGGDNSPTSLAFQSEWLQE